MSKEVKIAHTADTHLRARQYGYKSRGDDFFSAACQVVTKAKEEGCACILNAGDILDVVKPSSDTGEYLKRLNKVLIENEMIMYTISGNHDLTKPHWIEVLTDEADEFGIKLVDYKLFTIPGSSIKVYGLPYMTRDRLLQQRIPAEAHIIMWHGTVKEMYNFAGEKDVSLEDFPRNKHIMLGDIHEYKLISRDDPGGPPMDTHYLASYPGSTELCSFGEPTEKVFNVWKFDGREDSNSLLNVKTIPIETRPAVRYELYNEQDLEEAIAELRSAPANIMVYVKHDPDLENVRSRIRAVLDDKDSIFRSDKFPSKKFNAAVIEKEIEEVDVSDFLGNFMQPGTSLHELGDALLKTPDNASALMDAFIDKELQV
jgi:DNA repair exonuclease SbcCD nuclease subunit